VRPQVSYAKSGDIHIAYQVLGEGPMDLVFVPGWVSHVEAWWELPLTARFLRRLASFSRLIVFDKRGTGASDRLAGFPTIEERIDDVRAVMDAIGSEKAALAGFSEGGTMCTMFAASHPARTSALVLYGAFARWLEAIDYSFGSPPAAQEAALELIQDRWGQGVLARLMTPTRAQEPEVRGWWARFESLSASPASAVTMARVNAMFDVRHVLPAIQVPTLVLHRAGDTFVNVAHGRYLAEHIPHARYVELPGTDHMPATDDAVDAVIDEIREFLTGQRPAVELERFLATVVFTDIVGSTERAAALGDRAWMELLKSYSDASTQEIARYGGRVVKWTGDGLLATFDGPTRAVRSALAISAAGRRLGLETRIGVHLGECEPAGEDIGGLAVHIAARVMEAASPGRVLVSSTVKDVAAGSGLRFIRCGRHVLKGVPDAYDLFEAEA
jgi:pimeloyl-ACP methyl ester carboxylesterase